jgi:cell division septum initiation protein DivIVA
MKQGSKGIWDKVRGLGKPDEVGQTAFNSGPRGSRLIWGEHFDVVDGGLSEAQIVPFVEDLLARYNRLLEPRGSTGTVNSYLQKVMGEIDQIQSTVTSQIRKDAEIEASRIINESRGIAQGIIAEARKEASELASQEASGILESVKKKAEIADGQIKLQTQLIQEKAQEQLRNFIQQEGSEAYRRLLAPLKALQDEAQQLEEEWKRRTSRLWKTEDLRVALDLNQSSGESQDVQ